MISSCASWFCRLFLGVLIVQMMLLVVSWLGRIHPLAEAVSNVRLQLALFLVLPFVGFIVMRQWRFAAVAVVGTVLAASTLFPYIRTSVDPLPADGQTMTMMQYNIYFGNDDYRAIVAHIEESDADVVVLHELLPSQWEELEPLLDEYPFRIAEPLSEDAGQPGGGMAMISRTPLTRLEVDAATSPEHRVTLVAETEIDGEELLLVGLHPHASRHSGSKIALREQQLQGVVRLTQDSELPAVILSDLNIAPTSPLYRGFLDELGWDDPHERVGWQSSWPAWSGPIGIPLDHILVSNEVLIHRYRTGDGAGSDHKSITAELSIP